MVSETETWFIKNGEETMEHKVIPQNPLEIFSVPELLEKLAPELKKTDPALIDTRQFITKDLIEEIIRRDGYYRDPETGETWRHVQTVEEKPIGRLRSIWYKVMKLLFKPEILIP